MTSIEKIRVGVSDCLLGHPVRYDGQHKHDHFITDTLGIYFDLVGVCPEVECGLGIPREPVHLADDLENPRLIATRTGIDHTERMQAWVTRRVAELEKEGLHGFIFKAKSPSSGLEKVKVYNSKGGVIGSSPGMFAKAFMAAFPNLPCEDEGRLNDPDLRENFIERVFTLWRFRRAVGSSPTLRTLMEFHARNKLLIQSHHEPLVREMGRELAHLKPAQARAHIPVYESKLMLAMKTIATVRKHTNILEHMSGYLRGLADDADRKEMAGIIRQYHDGLVPLIVPVTMLKHYVLKHNIEYLRDQYYLDPHPAELKLRNHA